MMGQRAHAPREEGLGLAARPLGLPKDAASPLLARRPFLGGGVGESPPSPYIKEVPGEEENTHN